MDVKQLSYLVDVEGLEAGTIDLTVHGHNCIVTPRVAQRNPHFWQRHHKKPLPPSAKVLPPDPDCVAGYLLVGSMKMRNIAYRNEYIRMHGINGGAELHITPTELLFTALSGYLPGGGGAKGQLKIENWLGESPTNAAANSPTIVAAATTVNCRGEEHWRDGSGDFVEIGAGAACACLPDGDGGAHTAALDYGYYGSGGLWRSWV